MKKRLSIAVWIYLLLAFFLSSAAALAIDAPKGSPASIIFILDASGSMWGKVEGKAKIDIAKTVMKNLIKDLPQDGAVGLVAYGHRSKGDCNDVEELVPLKAIHREELVIKPATKYV